MFVIFSQITYDAIPVAQIWFYLAVTFILEGLAVYTWQYRKMPGALPQAVLQAGKGLWLVSIVLAATSLELPYKMFWIGMQEATSLTVLYCWLRMILEISGQDKQIPSILQKSLFGLLAVFWLAMFSNDWHGWYWGPIWLDGNNVETSYRPLCMLAWWYSRVMMLLNTVFSVRWVVRSVGLRRWHAVGMTISPLVSLAGYLLYEFLNLPSISPLPLSFLLSGLFITWIYYRWRVYSIMPFAQEAVIRNMIDGLVVIDEQGYIIETNPAAQEAFAGILPALIGRKFSEIAAVCPELRKLDTEQSMQGAEVALSREGKNWYYYVQLSPLANKRGYYLGKVLLLKDITQQKLGQAKLLEQEKALSILTERNRLGRELHDGQAQVWNYLQMELQTVQGLLRSRQWEQAAAEVVRLKQMAAEVTADVRGSIAGLKNSADEGFDFIVMLREYLEWYEKNYGIAVKLEVAGNFSLGVLNNIRKVQLLRIIQEALTNVRKHAQAKQVTIHLTATEKQMAAEIADDGRGFDLAASSSDKKSYGLQIMRERAEEAGGCFEVQSKLGQGTIVRVAFTAGKAGDNETLKSVIGR